MTSAIQRHLSGFQGGARHALLVEGAAAVAELERRREQRKAIQSLEAFVRAFWHVVEPRRPLVWSWHLTLICQELERSYRGEFPGALVINIPPRHSKSSIVGILAPAWWWLHRPEHQFLCITKAHKNAKRDARHMRRVVGSPEYQQLLQRLAMDGKIAEVWRWSPDQNELEYFANSAGGHRISITTGSDVTGVGADTLILDDVHDAEETANSTADRAARLMAEVQVKHDEVWLNRLNPGGHEQIIMQRLHERDLSGVMLSRPDTTPLVLPLEFEPDHPYRHPKDPRTEPGETLCAGRFSEKDLARLKTTPQMYAGQAQQRPSPKGGGQIKREWFKFYKCKPADWRSQLDECWVTSDAAKKATANADFHAVQVWGRIGARKILLDRRHERMTYPQYEKLMDGIIALWKPDGVLVEDTANGTTYLQCRQATVSNLIGFNPSQTPGNDKSKAARAIYLERAAEAGQVELPDPKVAPWVEGWIFEVCGFPSSAHDDDVDAASQLVMRWSLQEHQRKNVQAPAVGKFNQQLAGRLDFRD